MTGVGGTGRGWGAGVLLAESVGQLLRTVVLPGGGRSGGGPSAARAGQSLLPGLLPALSGPMLGRISQVMAGLPVEVTP
jgi:hypothetical protein